MADGATHIHSNLIVAGTIPPAIAVLLGEDAFALGVCVGLLAGILLTPDLDLNQTVSSAVASNGRLMRSRSWLARLVGWGWFVLWLPYALVVPHRHPVSHWPFLGTAVRLGYLGALVYLGGWLVMGEDWHWLARAAVSWGMGNPAVTGGLSGLLASDILHWILDGGRA